MRSFNIAISVLWLVAAATTKAFQSPFVSSSRNHAVVGRLFMSTSEKSVKDITTDAEERMKKTIDSVKTNLLTIRTGRASANMLDRVKLDYYGTYRLFSFR